MFQGDWHTTGVWVARKCVSELEFLCPVPLCTTRVIASRDMWARAEYFTGIHFFVVQHMWMCTCSISASVSFESSYRPLGNKFLLLYHWTWWAEKQVMSWDDYRVNCTALDNEHVNELGIFFNFQAITDWNANNIYI